MKFPEKKFLVFKQLHQKIPFHFSGKVDFECLDQKPSSTNIGEKTTIFFEQSAVLNKALLSAD